MEHDYDALRTRIREVLMQHDVDDPIPMLALHQEVTGELLLPSKAHNQARITRQIIADLREQGCPIGTSGKGYFWARKPEELALTIERFQASAMHHLRQVKALQKISAAALASQVQLDLEREEVTS